MSATNQGLVNSKMPTNAIETSGWIDGTACDAPMSVVFTGLLSGDTCDVRVTNSNRKPTATNYGEQYGSNVTSSTAHVVEIAVPFRWLMIRRTTKGSPAGVVSGMLYAHRPPA